MVYADCTPSYLQIIIQLKLKISLQFTNKTMGRVAANQKLSTPTNSWNEEVTAYQVEYTKTKKGEGEFPI